MERRFFRLGFFSDRNEVAHFMCDLIRCWPGEVVFFVEVTEGLRYALSGQPCQAAGVAYCRLFRILIPKDEYEERVFLGIVSRLWEEHPKLLDAVSGPLPEWAREYEERSFMK